MYAMATDMNFRCNLPKSDIRELRFDEIDCVNGALTWGQGALFVIGGLALATGIGAVGIGAAALAGSAWAGSAAGAATALGLGGASVGLGAATFGVGLATA